MRGRIPLVRTTKLCPKCNTEKSLDDFIRDYKLKSGVGGYCRPCARLIDAKRRLTEKYIVNNKIFKENHKRNYPQKVKARKISARNRKKLIKESCENCGAKDKLQMHHPDYSKPLDVITLCIYCHAKVHCREARR